MRDHEATQIALRKHGFNRFSSVEELPESVFIENYDEVQALEGPFALKTVVPRDETLLYHATKLKHIPSILEDGLLPRCESLQQVKYPRSKEYEQLRECNTYFWNDRYAVLNQAVATLEVDGDGNLAIILVDMKGKTIQADPENQVDFPEDLDDPIEPMAIMHNGAIEKERIRCVCYLKEEYLPTVGSVLDLHINGDIDEWSSELADRDRWECRCRK